ncbi:MAG: lysyl-tRNA synthetase class 1 [Parvibaculaceae bacterium]|jgi:lysyl-tRNA synthetase class 1|nr:lysine--tRNA ligase [Parvibaculaceae bacterium]
MSDQSPSAAQAAFDVSTAALKEQAADSKAWPFEEARKLLKRLEKKGDGAKEILFETGYGPSGLPHIGTFGEVARTSMVRHAFSILAPDIPTKLLCFSDDKDGLRKVPGNVPNPELLEKHLNMPLSVVPDPFGTHDSFGAHNNARLRAFLDSFGFDYEFASASDYYNSGRFDDMLIRVLERFDKVLDIMLPSLRQERRGTYSPILPISPHSGQVLYVPLLERNAEAGTVVFEDPTNGDAKTEISVTGGACKLQWKADWAMRWAALKVDYEMSGKDLIDSVKLSNKICRALGETPPDGFNYELFLDEKGEKISKTKGNGLSIEDWLRYASPESLQLFMYQSPRKAKRLHFDVIPKNVDEYLAHLSGFEGQDAKKRLSNPVWHLHEGTPPKAELSITFALLLNLVSAAHTDDPVALWSFIQRYAPEATPETHPSLDKMVGYAINYFNDFVKPNKTFRAASEQENAAFADLAERLSKIDPQMPAEEIQNIVYAVGKDHEFENLRDWFKALYEVLLGESQGPRFGSFVALYGVNESVSLLRRAVAGDDLSAS